MDNRRRMMLATLGGGIPLSDLPEGSILKILEGGVLTDFYVAKHNYESGLNGAGKTLIVRKGLYSKIIFGSGNEYASSNINSWVYNSYRPLLDAAVQSIITPTYFYYTPGKTNHTVTSRKHSFFILSVTELGLSHSYANVEGTALPIASILRTAYLEDGSNYPQWTRSPYIDNNNVRAFVVNGGVIAGYTDNRYGVRPAFTLPADSPCKPNADGNYTLSI